MRSIEYPVKYMQLIAKNNNYIITKLACNIFVVNSIVNHGSFNEHAVSLIYLYLECPNSGMLTLSKCLDA